jgi:tetratricopeptide (TPR) repeat protein
MSVVPAPLEETKSWSRLSHHHSEAGRTSGDDTVLAEAHRALALVASRNGDLERAAAAFETAVEHFVRARQFAAAAAVYAKWASVPASDAHNGKPIEANVDKVSEAKRLIGTIANPIIRFEILSAELSLLQQSQTRPSVDMRKLTNELRELAKEVESTEMLTRSLHATAVVESGLDDQDRALAALQEKAALQRTSGSTLALGLTMSDMAAVTLRRRPLTDDNLDTAIRLLDEALHLAKDRGLDREMAILHGNRSWALLNRGRSQEALADSTMTVGFFDELLEWDRPNAFILAGMRAQVLMTAGDKFGAAEWAKRASDLATRFGFGEASINPEIRRHAKWLKEYQKQEPTQERRSP